MPSPKLGKGGDGSSNRTRLGLKPGRIGVEPPKSQSSNRTRLGLKLYTLQVEARENPASNRTRLGLKLAHVNGDNARAVFL